jgi:hypothetical protein
VYQIVTLGIFLYLLMWILKIAWKLAKVAAISLGLLALGIVAYFGVMLLK